MVGDFFNTIEAILSVILFFVAIWFVFTGGYKIIIPLVRRFWLPLIIIAFLGLAFFEETTRTVLITAVVICVISFFGNSLVNAKKQDGTSSNNRHVSNWDDWQFEKQVREEQKQKDNWG